MNKLLVCYFILIILLVGCGDTQIENYQKVKRWYPDSKIYAIPDHTDVFVVAKDSTLTYVNVAAYVDRPEDVQEMVLMKTNE